MKGYVAKQIGSDKICHNCVYVTAVYSDHI